MRSPIATQLTRAITTGRVFPVHAGQLIVDVTPPGWINSWLSPEAHVERMQQIIGAAWNASGLVRSVTVGDDVISATLAIRVGLSSDALADEIEKVRTAARSAAGEIA